MIIIDQAVLITQEWLNSTYGDRPGYIAIPEDGKTGRGTVRALIWALQFESGDQNPDGVFGTGTLNRVPTINMNASAEPSNIVYILQGGLWCKGISPHGFDGVFGVLTKNAVVDVQSLAGLKAADVNGVVTPRIWQAILTTDSLVLLYTGNPKIREIQQGLNKEYYSQIGISPCDGIYGRETAKALIKAIQAQQGTVIDGIWGTNTMNNCPTLRRGNTGPFVYLLQYALYLNGFDPNGFDGQFGGGAFAAVSDFQRFTCLDSDGIAGKRTWASLLSSRGDVTRNCTACDTATRINSNAANTLENAGFNIVGRYLTKVPGGLDKNLTQSEIIILKNTNFKIFPIYQTIGNQDMYFTPSQGRVDAIAATSAAIELGFPKDTIIYFAVDYDITDEAISNRIIPYFRSINNYIRPYRTGVYGPRSVCNRLYAQYLTYSSFVSDMSTGFSGNLGHKLPPNWSFDQIEERSNYGNVISIDRVISRGGGNDTGIHASLLLPNNAPYCRDSKNYSDHDFIDHGDELICSRCGFSHNPMYMECKGSANIRDHILFPPLNVTLYHCLRCGETFRNPSTQDKDIMTSLHLMECVSYDAAIAVHNEMSKGKHYKNKVGNWLAKRCRYEQHRIRYLHYNDGEYDFSDEEGNYFVNWDAFKPESEDPLWTPSLETEMRPILNAADLAYWSGLLGEIWDTAIDGLLLPPTWQLAKSIADAINGKGSVLSAIAALLGLEDAEPGIEAAGTLLDLLGLMETVDSTTRIGDFGVRIKLVSNDIMNSATYETVVIFDNNRNIRSIRYDAEERGMPIIIA